jgi:hypothetical protein
MSKFTLSINSHSLSDFQECESKYCFKHFIGIEPLGSRMAMERGTLFAKFLEILYKNRIRPRQMFKRVLNNPLLWTRELEEKCNISQSEAYDVYAVMKAYALNWKGRDWEPIAVEKGFSKIIYEDDENLFVWEGRPDLVAKEPHSGPDLVTPINGELIVCDHKTQGRANSIYQFNNQSRGYLWATGATKFAYNYITFTKTAQFRREVFPFTPAQIEDWRQSTIEWLFRVKEAKLKAKFLPSWNCSTIYGPCEFHRICEQPKPEIKSFTIKSQFKVRKLYRSW